MRSSSCVALALALSCLLCVVVSGADDEATNLSEFFSEKDATALEASLVAEANSHNGAFGSAQGNFQGAWALSLLSSANLSKLKPSLCKAAQSDLSTAVAATTNHNNVNLAEAANALRTIALLSCTPVKDSDVDAAVAAAKEGLSSAVPATLFHATTILAASKKAVDTSDLQGVLQSVVDLQKDDGTFGADSDDEGTLEASGQALETIKTVTGMFKLATADWDTVSIVAEKAGNLIDKMMESLESEANLVAVVQVLEGLQVLASSPIGDKITIEQENVALIADTLVAVKAAPSITEAGYVVHGIHLCADNKFYVPVVVSTITKAVSAAAKGQEGLVKVRVTDVVGKSVGKASVTLVSARIGDHVVHSDVKLAPSAGSDQIYEFNFVSGKIEHGTYTLELLVSPDNKAKPYGDLKVKRTVRATTTASIASLEIAVQDAKTGEGKPQSVEFPNKLKPITADYLQAIDIQFAVRSAVNNKVFHPHQAFVRLSNKKTGYEALFVTRVTDKRQKLKIVVADAAVEMFKNQGGEYDIELIVGDVHMDDAIKWHVGTVTLVFADDAIADAHDGAKPELHHTFRQPEKRPAAIVSLVFTGIILAAFFFLISLISKLNLGVMFPSGEKLLPTLVFHATLGLIMVLYIMYWLRLNMFQCLTILAPLSIVAILVGSRALA